MSGSLENSQQFVIETFDHLPDSGQKTNKLLLRQTRCFGFIKTFISKGLLALNNKFKSIEFDV